MSTNIISPEVDRAKKLLREICIYPEKMSIVDRKKHVAELLEETIEIYSSGLLHVPNVLPLTQNSFNALILQLDSWNRLSGYSANDEQWRKLFEDAA